MYNPLSDDFMANFRGGRPQLNMPLNKSDDDRNKNNLSMEQISSIIEDDDSISNSDTTSLSNVNNPDYNDNAKKLS